MEPNDKCKGITGAKVKSCIMFQPSDFVHDNNGNTLRKKRKYGKFTRAIIFDNKETGEASLIEDLPPQIYSTLSHEL